MIVTETPGSLVRRAAAAACLWVCVLARAAAAQEPLPDVPAAPDFLSRYDYSVDLAGLAYDDDRFSWDSHLHTDFDVVDYVAGRFSMLADYQVVMGNQLQPFDPNQGNYTLAGALSVRTRPVEYAAVFHHVSRHLSDRAKLGAIAMNMLAGRVLSRLQLPRGTTLDLRAEFGRVTQRSYIDYTWIGKANAVFRRPVTPRVGVYGRAYGDTYAVDPDIAGRERQSGGRLEGGVRIVGTAVNLELFGGYERVVDADPVDRQARRWAFAGFRLLN
jgi:hypothetical protein